MPDTAIQLGIIVPVRNCLDLTLDMLATIRTCHPYRLYVIDDRSDPPVKEWLKSRPDIVAFVDPPLSTGVAYNWNVGIAAAMRDGCTHMLVVNNDILIHPDTIDLMVARIDRGDVILVTAHDIGGLYRDPQAVFQLTANIGDEDDRPEFPCFMLTESTIRSIGWFDEGFRGAYFEDNDYHARIVQSGHRAIRLLDVPVFHYGCATVRTHPNAAPEINRNSDINRDYFTRKWGCLPRNSLDEMRTDYFLRPFNNPSEMSAVDLRNMELYYRALATPSDIQPHLRLMYLLGSSVQRITAISSGSGLPICAFLYSQPKEIIVYANSSAHMQLVTAAAEMSLETFRWYNSGSPSEIDETDLLFIDTMIDENEVSEFLCSSAAYVHRYIVVHGTNQPALRSEGHQTTMGLRAASKFVRGNADWILAHPESLAKGLMVLERLSLGITHDQVKDI